MNVRLMDGGLTEDCCRGEVKVEKKDEKMIESPGLYMRIQVIVEKHKEPGKRPRVKQ